MPAQAAPPTGKTGRYALCYTKYFITLFCRLSIIQGLLQGAEILQRQLLGPGHGRKARGLQRLHHALEPQGKARGRLLETEFAAVLRRWPKAARTSLK